jgi:hypothetical protein
MFDNIVHEDFWIINGSVGRWRQWRGVASEQHEEYMLNFRTNFWTDEDDDSTSPQIGSADAVARQIVRRLYSGRYVAGQRLIEADLTREFKVSRGSLREALRRLAAEGVVSITKHYGACIRSFTKSEVLDVVRVFETLLVLAVQQGAALAHPRMRFRASWISSAKSPRTAIILTWSNGRTGCIAPSLK